MSAEAAVRIRFSMPELEQRALERVARALNDGSGVGDLVSIAIVAWLDQAGPALDAATPPVPLDEYSLRTWRVVRWWLRRSPATEILSPAKLVAEINACAVVGDAAGVRAAALQLGRLAGDLLHPAQPDALEKVLAMQPEPMRSRLSDLHRQVRNVVAFNPKGGRA
ncbi:MAG: hypothetical protein ABR567_09465 [Myxococcales bacterium]